MWKKTIIALALITLPTCQAKTVVQENTTTTRLATTSTTLKPLETQPETTKQTTTRQIPDGIIDQMQTTTTSAQTIEELLCSMDWDCKEATKVAWCESRMNPKAISPTNRNGTKDHGLMQINNGAWQEYFGKRWAQVLDAEQNVSMAYEIYSLYGWQPWTCAP